MKSIQAFNPALFLAAQIGRATSRHRAQIIGDVMSPCSKLRNGRIAVGLFIALAVTLVSSPALGRATGIQSMTCLWISVAASGGTVPAAFGDPNNPTPFNVPDMAKGFGGAFTTISIHIGDWKRPRSQLGEQQLRNHSVRRAALHLAHGQCGFLLAFLVSLNRVNVNGLNPSNGIGAILGGGMDLPIRKGLAFRLFEADYVWGRHNYADFAAPEFPDFRRPSFEGVRLRTGLVFSWCAVPPTRPPVARYSHRSDGGRAHYGDRHRYQLQSQAHRHVCLERQRRSGHGKDTTAQIDTNGVAPGNYTVTAHVTDGKEKKNNEASCSANFTVKPLPPKNPPAMSCSSQSIDCAGRASVTITCSCTSPDGVSRLDFKLDRDHRKCFW